jgi:hypothetical protein
MRRFDKEVVENDPILLNLTAYSLWDRAFSNLRSENQELTDDYEELLSKELIVTGEKMSGNDADPQKRRVQLETIIQNSLSRMDATRRDYQIADHKFVLRNRQGLRKLQLMKALVEEAAGRSLEASLVWAGVCLLLPILADMGGIGWDASRNEFFYVTARIPYYVALRSATLPENQDPTVTDLKNSMQIEGLIVKLYQHVLEFQSRNILHFYDCHLGAAPWVYANFPPLEGREEMFSKVKDLENDMAKQMASWLLKDLRLERVEQRSLDLMERFVSIWDSEFHAREEQDPAQEEYAKAALQYPDFDETADILHVRDKYPEAPAESWLIDRLGRAITRRRQFLLYRKHHQNEQELSAFEDRPTSPDDGYFGRPMTEYADSKHGIGEAEVVQNPLPLPLEVNGLRVKYNKTFACPYCHRLQTVADEVQWKYVWNSSLPIFKSGY